MLSSWEGTERENGALRWDTPQNLRFQGQYLDRETGLHYNTFRYYDPTGGCYTQMDPIGLLGGLNTYTYVVDPLVWVDPLGLMSCSSDAATLRKNMTLDGMVTPGYKNAAHHIVMSNSTDPRMVALRLKMDDFDLHVNQSYNGVFLPTSSKEKILANVSSPAHSRIHTDAYKQNVYERLINAKDADEFVDGLENIRQLIMKGDFNY